MNDAFLIAFLFTVLCVCTYQILRYMHCRMHNAAIGWLAALFFGVALSVSLFYLEAMSKSV